MIGIVNYGLGNVQAFANIYKRLNIPAIVVASVDALRNVDHIILPGVGSFDWAMTRLNDSGLKDVLEQKVIKDRIPVLGICVGMQIMASRSDEGNLPGLDWIDAVVKKFEPTDGKYVRLPHMGWNEVYPCNGIQLFANIELEARFYFLHSYYFAPANESEIAATTDYNIQYASAVTSGNIFGVQFHPEKSHQCGIQLLKNFSET